MKRSLIILVVGLVLGLAVLPVLAQTSTPAPDTPTATIDKEVTTTVVPLPEFMLYTVRKGDTLTRIAQKFNTTAARLIELNKLADPDHLVIGQDLKVPVFIPTLTPIPSETLTPSATVPTETTTPSVTATICETCAQATSILETVNAPTQTSEPPTVTPLPSETAQPTATLLPPSATDCETCAQATSIFLTVTADALTATALRPTVTETPLPTLAPTQTEPPSPVPATATPIPPTVMPPTSAPSSFAVGVAVGLANADSARLAKESGAAWASLQVSWKAIEPTKGTRDYAALDQSIDALNGAGLKLLLTVSNAPDWARNAINEDGPPVNFEDFNTFMADVVQRYAGKVQAYEIWYEPNLRRNWNGVSLSAAKYVELLKGAYQVIKGISKDTLVISAGLSPTGFNDGKNALADRDFLRAAYQSGLAAVSDGIGAHPFGWGNPPEASCCTAAEGVKGWFDSRTFFFRDTLADYHAIMLEAKDSSKPIWVTAFGWGTADGVAAADTVNAQRFGFIQSVDQAKQARYLTEALQLGKLAGFVGPMFAFNLNGCQAVPANPQGADFYQCYYALLNANSEARPVYEALKNFPK